MLTYRQLKKIDINLKKFGIKEWYININKKRSPYPIYLKDIPIKYLSYSDFSLYSFFAEFKVDEKRKIVIFNCDKNKRIYKNLRENGALLTIEEFKKLIS